MAGDDTCRGNPVQGTFVVAFHVLVFVDALAEF